MPGIDPVIAGSGRRDQRPWIWAAVAMLAASLPFVRGFSLTSVFYVRDLAMFFWPRHLWMRDGLLSGSFPLWDPYSAAGQAFYSDALNQLFLPPVLLLRSLLPPVPGFNLIVALPFPLAALGAWLFLHRQFSPVSAAIGAIAFAASGPVVSTSNFPNLSWSVAWIPWLLWAVDRDREIRSPRSFSVVAALLGLQMLSGEPVTMIGTLALLTVYVVGCRTRTVPVAGRLRQAVRFGGAAAIAVAISAVQLVPTALAARGSLRGLLRSDNPWSVHPLSLIESALPHVFGNVFYAYDAQLPWIRPLNSGRDPFFYSLYVGPVIMLLALLGSFGGSRRWRVFWLAVVGASTISSFGAHTFVYPLLEQAVPLLRSFRFPAKFFLFASLGIAMLAANGVELLQARPQEGPEASLRPMRITMAAAATGVLVLVFLASLVAVAPFTGARAFYEIGRIVGVADPVNGAAYLFDSIPPVTGRALLVLIAGAVLTYVGWEATRRGQSARSALFALAIADLMFVNADLNPVLPAARLGPPAWIAGIKAHPEARFYFGGKFRGTFAAGDPDVPRFQWRPPRDLGVEEGRNAMTANLAMTPAAWGARELISYDLPELWPISQARAQYLFERAEHAARWRYLRQGGVRYCVLGAAPYPGAEPIALVGEDFGAMAVYDCVPGARRAYVVDTAVIVPDVNTQLDRLFDGSVDFDSTVMLQQPASAAAGSPGAPALASAHIVLDRGGEVVVNASAAAQGGYLVLLDSFDRFWRAEIDGQATPVLRANGLYRSVRLGPGTHTVRFVYRPTPLYAMLPISALAVLGLAILASGRIRTFSITATCLDTASPSRSDS